MKRSYINVIFVVLVLIEIVFSFMSLNEMYMFVNSTLQTKYVVLMIIAYLGFTLFSLFYWGALYPEMNKRRDVRYHHNEVYGFEHFNFIYTYHYLVYTVISFYCSDWPWVIMSVIMFSIWNYVRVQQNGFADEHDLEVAKENAKHKPTVVLGE